MCVHTHPHIEEDILFFLSFSCVLSNDLALNTNSALPKTKTLRFLLLKNIEKLNIYALISTKFNVNNLLVKFLFDYWYEINSGRKN